MRVAVSWSGGKDCSLTLYHLKNDPNVELVGLICTVSIYERVGLHGTKVDLIKKQAELINLPVYFILTNADSYENDFLIGVENLRTNGLEFETIAFGDIFLADLKTYREKMFRKINITPIFPLWGKSTKDISRQLVELQIESILVCINHKLLDFSLLGQKYSEIINKLQHVDLCGENGEFHTFVYNAPFFVQEISYNTGQVVKNEFNSYLDIF